MLNRLLVLVAVGGLLPLGARLWWGFELLSHFRLQYLAIAGALLLVAIAARRRKLALALATVCVLNAWPVLPYLPIADVARFGEPLSILNFNVNGENEDFEALLGTIREAETDLVAIVELRDTLDRRLERLAETFPYGATFPTAGNFGIGIVSRYPLATSIPFELGPTTGIESRVAIGDRHLTFIAVHLLAPMSAAMAATRKRQLELLAARASEAEGPVVICGDFNLSPYSPYFGDFERASGTRDLARGLGLRLSWPSFVPALGIPIDHCFGRGRIATLAIERLDSSGSDHYPSRIMLGW